LFLFRTSQCSYAAHIAPLKHKTTTKAMKKHAVLPDEKGWLWFSHTILTVLHENTLGRSMGKRERK